MKQYSVDLRERLLGAIDAGLSQAEASRLFGVGTSTITRWRQQRRTTGSLAPQPRPGRRPAIGPAQTAALQAQVAQHPDATLAEHCAQWARDQGVTLSVAGMSRALRRLGITLKKSPARHGAGPRAARRVVGGAGGV
jgi:transposase